MTREYGPVSTEISEDVPVVDDLRFTPREEEVLKCSAYGLTTKETSQCLDISEKTAEKHRSNILIKVGAASIEQAVLSVVISENPLLDLDELTRSYDISKVWGLYESQKEFLRQMFCTLKDGNSSKVAVRKYAIGKRYSANIRAIESRKRNLYRDLGIGASNKDLVASLLFLKAERDRKQLTDLEKKTLLFWAQGKRDKEISQLFSMPIRKLWNSANTSILRKLGTEKSAGTGSRSTAILIAFLSDMAIFGPEEMKRVTGQFCLERTKDLSPKECNILETIIRLVKIPSVSTTNQSIAKEMIISPRTVEKHMASLLHKLGVNNRAQAVLLFVEAKRQGIL
jgi:DNA-binding CsgD family transcriptional regulator